MRLQQFCDEVGVSRETFRAAVYRGCAPFECSQVGAQRTYTAAHVEKTKLMFSLMAAGLRQAEAARLVRCGNRGAERVLEILKGTT